MGLVVIPRTLVEFGSVMRRQKSDISDNTIFEQENFYYFCECEDKIVEQELDEYELQAGFVLRNVDLDEAIHINANYTSNNFFDEIMIQRELKVLRLLQERM